MSIIRPTPVGLFFRNLVKQTCLKQIIFTKQKMSFRSGSALSPTDSPSHIIRYENPNESCVLQPKSIVTSINKKKIVRMIDVVQTILDRQNVWMFEYSFWIHMVNATNSIFAGYIFVLYFIVNKLTGNTDNAKGNPYQFNNKMKNRKIRRLHEQIHCC